MYITDLWANWIIGSTIIGIMILIYYAYDEWQRKKEKEKLETKPDTRGAFAPAPDKQNTEAKGNAKTNKK